ncbi:MAG: hypothetical protein ACRYFS_16270 [Janthinobacterium lividum]
MTSFSSTVYSLTHRSRKQCIAFCLMSSTACFVLISLASAQTPTKIVIPRASQVVFSHTGIHTHANFVLFDTGSRDLSAMQHDLVHYPHLSFKAHSSLPTDRASLPPDMAAFSAPGDPPLENPYGSIDGGSGKPGWSLQPLHQNGKNLVKVMAPTRFANWLALQSPARRKQYLMPLHYTLVIAWDNP